jgi:hypothetical protein
MTPTAPTTPSALVALTSVIPAPVPNAATYGFIPTLQIVTPTTRSGYKAAAGTQYANWNQVTDGPNGLGGNPLPSLVGKPKYWAIVDPTVDPASLMIPNPSAASGSSGEVPLTIADETTGLQRPLTVAEMGAYNFPGLMTYDPYVPAIMQATQEGTGAVPNAIYFSNYADAVALAIQLGIPVSQQTIVDLEPAGAQGYVYAAGETRRVWVIVPPGGSATNVQLNVGIMLQQRNGPQAPGFFSGVGSPGQWNGNAFSPTWVPAALPPDGIGTGVAQAGETIQVPVRALIVGVEVIQAGLMGDVIFNTNLAQPPAAGGSGGGGMTTQQLTSLANAEAQISALIAGQAAIMKAMGIAN